MSSRSIVIVGQGAAGLCAALSAAEAVRARGVDTRITVVDRAPQDRCGGNSRWSPSNIRMASVDAVEPGFVDAVVAQSGGKADRAYFQRLAAEDPATVAWLRGLGLEFQSPPYYLSKGPARIQPVGGGAAILGALRKAVEASGVALLHGREARQLIVDERGAVRGVRVEAEPMPADAVVLACGGFEGNGEMMREQFGPGAERMRPISPGTPDNTGRGILMALEAGARRAGDWNGMHAEPVDARSGASAPVVLVYPYGIVVGPDGRRFFDEGAGLVHETWEGFARELHFRVPGGVAYSILDASLLDIPDYGRAIRSEMPPVRADSIASLAGLLGIPAAVLGETVAAYNAACRGDASRFDATRRDGLAATGLAPPKSNWARPLVRAPFLAWPLVGAVAYTFGGIDTDHEARVLGERGPIPGLYAAGEITGHFHGTAPNAVAMMRALVYGRIAGRNAIQ